jgi:secreted trypsin-like serine protease
LVGSLTFKNSSIGGAYINSSQIIMHRDYNNVTLQNDVALVRLATPATLSSTFTNEYLNKNTQLMVLLVDNIKVIDLPTLEHVNHSFVGPAVVSGVGNFEPVNGSVAQKVIY